MRSCRSLNLVHFYGCCRDVDKNAATDVVGEVVDEAQEASAQV